MGWVMLSFRSLKGNYCWRCHRSLEERELLWLNICMSAIVSCLLYYDTISMYHRQRRSSNITENETQDTFLFFYDSSEGFGKPFLFHGSMVLTVSFSTLLMSQGSEFNIYSEWVSVAELKETFPPGPGQ